MCLMNLRETWSNIVKMYKFFSKFVIVFLANIFVFICNYVPRPIPAETTDEWLLLRNRFVFAFIALYLLTNKIITYFKMLGHVSYLIVDSAVYTTPLQLQLRVFVFRLNIENSVMRTGWVTKQICLNNALNGDGSLLRCIVASLAKRRVQFFEI